MFVANFNTRYSSSASFMGETLLFIVDEQSMHEKRTNSEVVISKWSKQIPNLKPKAVKDNHMKILKEPNINTIAKDLLIHLDMTSL